MRLYRAVILATLTFGFGLLCGHLWWEREVTRLGRELDRARQGIPAPAGGQKSWSLTGIVRAVVPDDGGVMLTHEAIPGMMGPMTMTFRVGDRGLAKGLEAGDRVRFTLVRADKELLLVGVQRERGP